MLPKHYEGIWRRDWIERGGIKNFSPAIWFQSAELHVDLRVDKSLQGMTARDLPLPQTQIAFAGKTLMHNQDGREICQWHPQFAYPTVSDEPDCGYMEFRSDVELIETGIDGGYVESWRRINGSSPVRCLYFNSTHDSSLYCYLMICGAYFAFGSNSSFADCTELPAFAWGIKNADAALWRVQESLAPWWNGRDIELAPQLLDNQALIVDQRIWQLPIVATSDWCLCGVSA